MTKDQLEVAKFPKEIPWKRIDPPTHYQCDRCHTRFSSQELGQDPLACRYHFGRAKTVAHQGSTNRLLSCCQRETGSTGCSQGYHVFKEEDQLALAQRIPFIHLKNNHDQKQDLIAIDCEMAYTLQGMELVRVTCIGGDGTILLDEKCLPSQRVLDLNTRWSGIESLEGVKLTLSAIQDRMSAFCSTQTIFVGHGLENDFRALRIIHDRIIDTSILFVHPKGFPFRFSLSQLCRDQLGKIIQDASTGHDSFEDAMTCLELLYKYHCSKSFMS